MVCLKRYKWKKGERHLDGVEEEEEEEGFLEVDNGDEVRVFLGV